MQLFLSPVHFSVYEENLVSCFQIVYVCKCAQCNQLGYQLILKDNNIWSCERSYVLLWNTYMKKWKKVPKYGLKIDALNVYTSNIFTFQVKVKASFFFFFLVTSFFFSFFYQKEKSLCFLDIYMTWRYFVCKIFVCLLFVNVFVSSLLCSFYIPLVVSL